MYSGSAAFYLTNTTLPILTANNTMSYCQNYQDYGGVYHLANTQLVDTGVSNYSYNYAAYGAVYYCENCVLTLTNVNYE